MKISVSTEYKKDLSQINVPTFFFHYKVEIENTNDYDVQLLYREWYIFDSLNEARLIQGNGVIGEQPVLKPGEKYSYVSGCDLKSEIGMMKGFYTFQNRVDGELFEALVPTFRLEYPGKLN